MKPLTFGTKAKMIERIFGTERGREILLFVIVVAMSFLLYSIPGFKMLALNLFYLPVVLAAFYLGSQRAGILALLCVLMVSVVAVLDLESFAASTSPLVIGMTLVGWAATLGLVAVFVGALSDERSRTISELHDAHLGMIEVLTHHLKSADQTLAERSQRVATLCEQVARQMRLSTKEIDDIRVAALLQDMEHIEVTARVIERAVGNLNSGAIPPVTFQASDIVQSLSEVLSGALRLLINHTDRTCDDYSDTCSLEPALRPFGASVIRAVCEYDSLAGGNDARFSPTDALNALRVDLDAHHHPAVLHALEMVVAHDETGVTRRLQVVENLLRLGR